MYDAHFIDNDSNLELKDHVSKQYYGSQNVAADAIDRRKFDPTKFTYSHYNSSYNNVIRKRSKLLQFTLPYQKHLHEEKSMYPKNLYLNIDKHNIERIDCCVGGQRFSIIYYIFYDFFKHEYYDGVAETIKGNYTLVPIPLFSLHESIASLEIHQIQLEVHLFDDIDTNGLDMIVHNYTYDDEDLHEYLVDMSNHITGVAIGDVIKGYDNRIMQNHIQKMFVAEFDKKDKVADSIKFRMTNCHDTEVLLYELPLSYVLETDKSCIAVYKFKTRINMSASDTCKMFMTNMKNYFFIEENIICTRNGMVVLKFSK